MSDAPAMSGLAHYALVVRDVDLSRRWYMEVLGARLPPRLGNGPESIDIAGTLVDLFPAGGVTPAGIPLKDPAPGSIGQHHAFAIGLDDYDRWVEWFQALDVPHRRAVHDMRFMSVYVDDPDGYHIELTVQFADEETAAREVKKRGLESRTFDRQASPVG